MDTSCLSCHSLEALEHPGPQFLPAKHSVSIAGVSLDLLDLASLFSEGSTDLDTCWLGYKFQEMNSQFFSVLAARSCLMNFRSVEKGSYVALAG